eukprot:TRINITY_DN8143_c0_g1_i2.p1 TRINITY_DN8143_c0_g1~~TRINITY_DN8143_c0_g1_i2.p1  ORF type:complete len:250 (+),score=19.61 TRINITY_DN8143_c0_g1_i2:955-1704(+)
MELKKFIVCSFSCSQFQNGEALPSANGSSYGRHLARFPMSKRRSKPTKWQRAAENTTPCQICHQRLRIYRRKPASVCKRCATVQDMLAQLPIADLDNSVSLLRAKADRIGAKLLARAPLRPTFATEASSNMESRIMTPARSICTDSTPSHMSESPSKVTSASTLTPTFTSGVGTPQRAPRFGHKAAPEETVVSIKKLAMLQDGIRCIMRSTWGAHQFRCHRRGLVKHPLFHWTMRLYCFRQTVHNLHKQ